MHVCEHLAAFSWSIFGITTFTFWRWYLARGTRW